MLSLPGWRRTEPDEDISKQPAWHKVRCQEVQGVIWSTLKELRGLGKVTSFCQTEAYYLSIALVTRKRSMIEKGLIFEACLRRRPIADYNRFVFLRPQCDLKWSKLKSPNSKNKTYFLNWATRLIKYIVLFSFILMKLLFQFVTILVDLLPNEPVQHFSQGNQMYSQKNIPNFNW